MQCFISHSSIDKPFARRIADDMGKLGVKCWLDEREINVGDSIPAKIQEGLLKSNLLILLLSRNSCSSNWVTEEWISTFWDQVNRQALKVLPVLIDDCEIPYFLRSKKYADFRVDYRAGLNELIKGLNLKAEHELTEVNSNLSGLEDCISYLLSLQFPWGEWSDRRKEIESKIAERKFNRGLAGPKPNMARTLFAIDLLGDYGLFKPECDSALVWMNSGCIDGWYYEWSTSQTEDSESHLPNLFKRQDIRHTAQLATAQLKWGRVTAETIKILENIVSSKLSENDLWPEAYGHDYPRVLASVYCLEALGYAVHISQDSIKPYVSSNWFLEVKNCFRKALLSITLEVEKGNGLLRSGFSMPTPYLTGLLLFRIAELGAYSSQVKELIEIVLEGLKKSISDQGWTDTSVPESLREETRIRTNLRIAAGVSLCIRSKISVPIEIILKLSEITRAYFENHRSFSLDSPDYACLLFSVKYILENKETLNNFYEVSKKTSQYRAEHSPLWLRIYDYIHDELKPGEELLLHGYRELVQEIIVKKHALKSV